MRPWDNFFWFAELHDFPPRSMTSPANWPPPKNTAAASLSGKLLDNKSGLTIDSSGAKATIWLAPEYADFERKFQINGRSHVLKKSLETMLEDVRTRADRQHPFWARVDL